MAVKRNKADTTKEGATKSSRRGPKMPRKKYEAELYGLQVELVKLQDWVKATGARIVVVFEGRDAAGKGGMIKRITERVSPRVFRVVALPTPTEREKTQLYMQRYIAHLPAAGEVVLFDRSWYNRAGVERVMGFVNDKGYDEFMRNAPAFESWLVRSGITLIKFWIAVSNKEQERRFLQRINDPLRRWKLSPMDLESRRLWYQYSKARDAMMTVTDTQVAPWNVVIADDKRRARLNCISHLLDLIPYRDPGVAKVKLPKRSTKGRYDDVLSLTSRRLVPHRY